MVYSALNRDIVSKKGYFGLLKITNNFVGYPLV